MRLVKSVRGSALITLVTFGLAACGESPTSPVAESPEPALLLPDAAPLLARYGGDAGSRKDDYRHSADLSSGTRTFRVEPGQPTLKWLGNHLLWIPAGAICDPETSSYGPEEWDTPCEPISRPIKITAKWTTVKGNPAIRFTPELRFVPTTNRDGWVMLWARAPEGVAPRSTFAVLWRNPETLQWIDESASDPTLRAKVDSTGKIVARRLKHFSDYLLWVGLGSYNVTSGYGGEIDWGSW